MVGAKNSRDVLDNSCRCVTKTQLLQSEQCSPVFCKSISNIQHAWMQTLLIAWYAQDTKGGTNLFEEQSRVPWCQGKDC